MKMLSTMLLLATRMHDGQFDKGGKPYIMHPIAVMNILSSDDEELNCVALLHDVVEDTKTTWEDLYDLGCSTRIVEAVQALTKMPGQSYSEYQEGVFANRDAMLVKKADLTHNTDIRRLKGVTQKDIDRMAKYNRFYLEIESRL